MELKLNFDEVFYPQTIYENYIEDKLEGDLILPDYLSSAQKIIHCEANPVVLNKSITDDKITLDGICIWKIIYLSEEDDMIHSATCEKSFTENFAISKSEGALRYKIKTKNTVCKLLSSQKAICKTSLCIAVQVNGISSQKIVSAVENDELQLCSNQQKTLIPVTEFDKEFKVLSEIAYKARRDMQIHKACSELIVKERRCSEGKVVLRGICKTTVVLISKEDCFAECVETETPFTQTYDIENAEEKYIVMATVDPVECDATINEEDGQKLILVNTSVAAQVSIFKEGWLMIASDAYHSQYEIETKLKPVPYYAEVSGVDIPIHCTQNVHMKTIGIDILYTETCGEVEKISVQDDLMIIDGKLNVMFLSMLDGEVVKNSFILPFQTTRKAETAFERLKCDASVAITNFNYLIINDAEIEVDCELRVYLAAYVISEMNVAETLEIKQEHAEKPMKSPLILYYGKAGEKLWDIGKKYYVPINVIKTNNDLSDDVLKEDKLIFLSKR